MIGNNIQYEPKFEKSITQKSKERIAIDEVGQVPSISAFGRTHMRALEKSHSKLIYNRDNISTLNHSSFVNRQSAETYNQGENTIIP